MSYKPKYDYRVKDSLPSGNTAKVIRGTELMEEFEAISDDLIRVESGRLFAACTYNGQAVIGESYGISGVEWIGQEANGQPDWKFAKIGFTKTLASVTSEESSQANGDVNARANVQVTAFATSVASTGFVFGTIVDLEPNFVVVAFLGPKEDGSLGPVWDTGFCLAVFEDVVQS
jgi:hypothetical protein